MSDSMIGRVLGDRYEILEKIGTGGMAIVYKARCTLLNRNVAVKILRDEFQTDQEFIARFNIEAQAAASLSHTNIVSIFDVGTEENLHYIVMEYVPGITLKDYIKENGAIPWKTALDYALQISAGIEHAHKQNIIHRDIKPHNIIMTEDNVLKVTDFGIARALNANTITVCDNTMGSVHYFSPEQARGGYTDEKSDIYSLGVVMYEMLTGHVPFEADSPVSVALMHIQEEPLPILIRNPEVPTGLADIVMKAMAKEQIGRYESVTALIEALKGFKTGVLPVKPEETDNGATRVVPVLSGAGKRIERKKKDAKKAPATKEDKIAVFAGIAVSFLIVGLILLFVLKPFANNERIELMVPALVGKNIEEIQEQYKESEEFEIVVVQQISDTEAEENEILSQEPKADKKISAEKGIKQRIEVVVSSGVERLLTPKVVGLDVRQAEIDLKNAKLVPNIIEEESDEPTDTVIRQYPLEGKEIKVGEEVVLYVSSGSAEKEPIALPNVVGKSVSEAKNALKDFSSVSVVYEYSDSKENTIVKQSPDAGEEIKQDVKITLTASKGKAPVNDRPNEPIDTPNPPVDAPATKNVSIKLPTTSSDVEVLVKADGKQIYKEKVATSNGRVNVPVSGTGKVTVDIYFDGSLAATQSVSFDE